MLKKTEKLRTGARILYIPIDLLRSHPYRARTVFSEEAMASLVCSIAENGVLEPLTVCYGEDDLYYVISGERRLRAAKRLEIPALPCVLIDCGEAEALLYTCASHLQQTSLDAYEKAEFLERTSGLLELTYAALAERTGVPEGDVRDSVRLLSIPAELRRLLRENGCAEAYANILLRHADDREKRVLLEKILAEHLSPEAAGAASEEMLRGKRKENRNLITFFKDLTVFINTIDRAVDAMRDSGIAAESEKTETGESVEYRIRIPKPSTVGP